MLALDLGVFHRKSHVVGFKESLGWSAVWITLGVSFSVLVFYAYGNHWFGLGLQRDAVDGVKMLTAKWLKMWLGDSFNLVILGVILGILVTGVVTSLLLAKKEECVC